MALRSPFQPDSRVRPIKLDQLDPQLSLQSVDERLSQLAQRLMKLTGLKTDNIIDRYFLSFHHWLCAISPGSFRAEASHYQDDGSTPPADFTVLLLSMWLIVLPTLTDVSRPDRATQELFYTIVKSAFSEACASTSASLRLVQAALLVTLREYTSIRLEAAYVSMMTCAGLAQVAGLGQASVRATKDVPNAHAVQMNNHERSNTAWAVAMLQGYDHSSVATSPSRSRAPKLTPLFRLILCEMGPRKSASPTKFSDPNAWKSSKLGASVAFDYRPRLQLHFLDELTPLSVMVVDTDNWRSHSLTFLDRLLSITNSPAGDNERKLEALTVLDSDVRYFLKVVMDAVEWQRTFYCGFVCLCVR